MDVFNGLPGLRSRLLELKTILRRIVIASQTTLGRASIAPVHDGDLRSLAGHNELIASLVSPGARVLCLGYDDSSLAREIAPGCVIERCSLSPGPSRRFVELLPRPNGRYDYVVVGNSVEAVSNPQDLLAELANVGDELIVSYPVADLISSRFERRSRRWISDLTRSALESLLSDVGMTFEHFATVDSHDIYRLSRRPLARLASRATVSPRERITVCGSFGYRNAGDEGAWLAVQDLLADLNADIRTDILTRFPRPDMIEVIGVGPSDRTRRSALAGNPLVFVGGGIIDASPQCVFLATEPFIREVALPSMSLVSVSCEAGAEYPKAIRDRIANQLGRMRTVTVRDEVSAQTLHELAPTLEIQITGDIVLWIKPERVGLPSAVTTLERYVAVNLAPRWLDDNTFYDWIVPELESLGNGLDVPLVFVPCSTRFDDDRVVHDRIVRAIRERDPKMRMVQVVEDLQPKQTAGILAGAVATVGMRLHACVMSYATGVPCVGLAYHSKLHGFARTVGAQEHFLPRRLPIGKHEISAGFSFADSGLASCNLLAATNAAIAGTTFDRRDDLKRKSAAALVAAIRR